jgi:hypothetical protein
VVSRNTPMTFLRLRTSTGASIARVLLDASGRLAYRSDVTSVTRTSQTVVGAGVWNTVDVHL